MNYIETIASIKERIAFTQQRAVQSINAQLLFLYWDIGTIIAQRQDELGWGAKVIKQMSTDIRSEFPHLKGFSVRNLKYMSKFAKLYPVEVIVQTASAQLGADSKVQTASAQMPDEEKPVGEPPSIGFYTFVQASLAAINWSHHIVLMDKTNNASERAYYLNRTIVEAWSIRVLSHKIEQKLYESQGRLPNNFDRTLPDAQANLAKQALKDPYLFDFLHLGDEARERDVENGLLKEVTKFLLELGNGFAFLGQQYHLSVGGQDYYLDLLFYHTKLRCYFIIELKIDEFKPEYAGKINFYINAVDDLIKTANDKDTIGLLLCKTSNKVIVEYTLKDIDKPIGVATYKLLPKEKELRKLLEKKL